MAMTAAEKILSRASGLKSVRPGDIIYPNPDIAIVHDGYIASSKAQLDDLGIHKLFSSDRVLLLTDHSVVYTTVAQAERGSANRKAAAAWGVENFFDVGRGGQGHIFPMEMGIILPGSFVFANDMHCSNFGAVGALALRTGTEIICVLATGTLWVEVPPSIQITITGQFQKGVHARDLGYRLARDFTNRTYDTDWDYRVIEITGDTVESLPLDLRVPICNTLTEIGVATVFFPPSERVISEAQSRTGKSFIPVYSDADAVFESKISVDVRTLAPQVVLPGSPDQATDVDRHVGVPINHAQIGSCGSGMYTDLVVAAEALSGRKIAAGTRLFITPGTVAMARRAADEGLMQIFQDAGAIVLPAGCGPCAGGQMAPLVAGEVSISTGATNVKGRMGSSEASIYLASPATVVASAITGKITDPRSPLPS